MHCRVAQVMCNHATYCTAITLTFTCEAAGMEAGGWGRSWCLCFLEVVWCAVVVCWEVHVVTL